VTTPTLLAHRGHLRWNDLGLKCRCQLLRFGKPQPEVSQASLLVALDAGQLVSLRTPGRSSATNFTRHTSGFQLDPRNFRLLFARVPTGQPVPTADAEDNEVDLQQIAGQLGQA